MRISVTSLHGCMPTATVGSVGTRRYSSKYDTVQSAGCGLRIYRLFLASFLGLMHKVLVARSF